MKKSTIIGTIVIAFITIAMFTLYAYFLYSNRSISPTTLVLQIKSCDTSKTQYAISNLKELDTIVSNLNKKTEEKNLLEIYERERAHYVLLISIVAFLLTISIAFTIIQRLVEKDDLIEQRNTLNSLELNLKKELDDVRFINLRNDILYLKDILMECKVIIIDDENKTVDTEEKFLSFFKNHKRLREFLDFYKNELSDEKRLKQVLLFRNLIVGANAYSKAKGFINNGKWSKKDNSTFKGVVTWLEDCLGKKLFAKLKEELKKTPETPEWKDD